MIKTFRQPSCERASGQNFLDDMLSEMPEDDYLWKKFGFCREYNLDVLKQIIPSDSETISIGDFMDGTHHDDDDDDIVNHPYKGYRKMDCFYNESPFETTQTSGKKLDITPRIVTLEEKMILIISTSFRYNSGGLVDLMNSLQELNKETLVPILAPKLTGVEFVLQYFCPNCNAILKFDKSKHTICRSCHSHQGKSDVVSRGCYFISISLKEQLKELVNSHLYPLLSKKHKGSDITSSTMYQEMAKKMGNEDLSLQWNVSKVKTSATLSTYLIQVMVNELPYRLRTNNVFLCGIWHGETKHRMNAFLHPFISELIDLRVNGLTCTTYFNSQPITIKFHTLFCTAETDVRASILNTAPPYKSYNCSYCLKQDKTVPFSEDHFRTYDLHMKHCELAVKCGKIVKGVLGPTVVMLDQDINVLESFPPDFVEICLLGVCKTIVANGWFNAAWKRKSFYLGPGGLQLMNAKLKKTKRPCEVTRIPPREWTMYLASDWRNFVLYYSQHCLKDLLPDIYFDHWMLIVKALHMFSKATLNEDEVQVACTHLNHFLELAYLYYPYKIFKWTGLHKLHQLKHLPHFIQRYGALWAWSSFPYRRYDDIVRGQFQKSGHDYSPEQLVETFSQLRYLLNNSGSVLTPARPMLDEYLETMNGSRVKGCFHYGDRIRPLGQSTKMILQPGERNHLRKMCWIKSMHRECEVYARFALNGVLFHSYKYEGLKNIDNSVFRTKDRTILRVVELLNVRDLTEEVERYVVKAKEIRVLVEYAWFYDGEETENIVYIDYSNIECKCFTIIDYNHKPDILLVIPIPNPFETY